MNATKHSHKSRMKRWVVSLAVVLAGLAAVFAYGWYIGFGKFEVNRIDLTFADLPPAFDGYRIVHFSDAHLGSFTGWREDLLRRDIDSIRAQKADMVVFTGDLQNRKPAIHDYRPRRRLLCPRQSRLHDVPQRRRPLHHQRDAGTVVRRSL